MKRVVFLRWWLLFVVMVLGAGVVFHFGGFHTLWAQDATRLSFVILALFTGATLYLGKQSWSLSSMVSKGQATESGFSDIEDRTNTGWFIAQMLFSLGMIGTVYGFVQLLGGFISLDITSPTSMQGMIKDLGAGLGVALYTTLAGLVTGLLLRLQCFNLSQVIDRVNKNHAKRS